MREGAQRAVLGGVIPDVEKFFVTKVSGGNGQIPARVHLALVRDETHAGMSATGEAEKRRRNEWCAEAAVIGAGEAGVRRTLGTGDFDFETHFERASIEPGEEMIGFVAAKLFGVGDANSTGYGNQQEGVEGSRAQLPG